MDTNNFTIEAKSWLAPLLQKENLKDLSLTISGKTEKGDGYVGDIIFVVVTGVTNGVKKEYNLVLKCNKQSEAVKQFERFKYVFLNEIFFYETVLPTFKQFQQAKGLEKLICVPKCYGTFVGEREVLALENLNLSGYELWPRTKPLTRKHIDLVIQSYAQFHAVSVAMKYEKPEEFENIVRVVDKHSKSFFQSKGTSFKTVIDESYNQLRGELEEKILLKWKLFGEKIPLILCDITDIDAWKVIIHGDCWSGNFMYKYENGDKLTPTEVAILDWQLIRYSSLIYDVSYFLFSCISEQDIIDVDGILSDYYTKFSSYLEKLGATNLKVLYSFEEFIKQWKMYCKFGIVMACFLIKLCSIDKENVVDLSGMVNNTEVSDEKSFISNIKGNNNRFKNRIRYIVEYVVNKDLV